MSDKQVELFEEVTSICNYSNKFLPKALIKQIRFHYKSAPPISCEDFLNNRLSKLRSKYVKDRLTSHLIVQQASKWYYQQAASSLKHRRMVSQVTQRIPPISRTHGKDCSYITEESQESDRSEKDQSFKHYPKSIRNRLRKIFNR